MEWSSPLSSPPSSSVLDVYESDRDRDRDRAASPPLVLNEEASSPIDFIPTSPRVTPPPSPLQAPASFQPAPLMPVSPAFLPQDAAAEATAQDEQPGGVDALPQLEEESPSHRQPESTIFVAEEAPGSSPPYTANTFALAVPSSPKEKQRQGGKQKPKQETEAPAPKGRSRPQRRSKTPVTSGPQKDADCPQTSPVSATPAAVATTRSGRRIIQKRHPNEVKPVSSPPSAVKTKTPAKISATTSVKASPSAAAAVLRRRKLEATRWQTDFVLANTRSPLGNFDLRTLLCQPEAWTALSVEEQKEVLALFPTTTAGVVVDAGTDAAHPDIASLKNDNNFRHDCARYRSDLQAGFYNKQWLEEAFEAHAMRHEGMFDAYVVEEFESSWGVAVPDEHKPASVRSLKGEWERGEVKEAKEVPKSSLKRSRPLVKVEENGLPEGDREDGPSQQEKNTKESDRSSPGTPPVTPKRKKRSPKRQKQGDEGANSEARFTLVPGSPVRRDEGEGPVEDTIEVTVKHTINETTEDTIEAAQPTAPAKRKASASVPMRSRKRITPSVPMEGQADGVESASELIYGDHGEDINAE